MHKLTNDGKICQTIFTLLKNENIFEDFPALEKVEKNYKNYDSYITFAEDIRKTFSCYFEKYSSVTHRKNYVKLFEVSSKFEEIYKNYENKNFVLKSKKYLEIKKRFNKLKKEIKSVSTNNNNNYIEYTNNVFKFSFDKGDVNLLQNKQIKNNRNQNRNFKLELAKKIQLLSDEQKKGIVNILPKTLVGSQGILEFDINKMGANELRNLQNYISSCLGEDKIVQNEQPAKISISNEIISEDILNDDEISESLSDEDESSIED